LSNVVAVFGISGVGKTTACKAFVKRNPEVVYVSASDVLGKLGRVGGERLTRLSKEEVLENQALLEEGLPKVVSCFEGRTLLLDAQNVIDNGVELIELPSTTLRALHPRGMILLEADAADVYQRRIRDVRSRPARTCAEIRSQIQLIHLVTTRYADELKIPIVFELVTEGFEIDAAVNSILAASSN
jgi:adenylate kinase